MKRYRETLWKVLENKDLGLLKRLAIAFELVKEVERVHSSLLVHRDLKPTNIMVGANEKLVLVDFGISSNRTVLTGSSGTPGFNAPEQYSGDTRNEMVDIFSLGKCLALIFFKWRIGWTLLWSSNEWLTKNDENKLAPLSDLFNAIRQMLQVYFKNYLSFFIISI